MDSSSSDEECQLQHWNNWKPSTKQSISSQSQCSKESSNNYTYSINKRFISVSASNGDPKFGNWIPPTSFPKVRIKTEQEEKVKRESVIGVGCVVTNATTQEKQPNDEISWRKILNPDWGERVELHDVTRFADGDVMWGMISLGLFAHIKLWINEYGNICGSADGTISKVGSSEVTFIYISNTQLLRKMLSVTPPQWASLCEVIQQTKTPLSFDALKDFPVTEKKSLEKLWFFLCKRRHFLPDKCVLVKLDGAVKCMREFRITPKLVVQDIRDVRGHPIE